MAVDGGGSPLSAQIIFFCHWWRKGGRLCSTSWERRGLQGTAAGRPGEPPAPLRKPLKTYPPLSDLRRSPPPPFAPPRALQQVKSLRNSVLCSGIRANNETCNSSGLDSSKKKKMIIILALKSVLSPGRPYHTSSLDLAFFPQAFLGILAHFSCET